MVVEVLDVVVVVVVLLVAVAKVVGVAVKDGLYCEAGMHCELEKFQYWRPTVLANDERSNEKMGTDLAEPPGLTFRRAGEEGASTLVVGAGDPGPLGGDKRARIDVSILGSLDQCEYGALHQCGTGEERGELHVG